MKVAVAEVKAAVRALQSGVFAEVVAPPGLPGVWRPEAGERVALVLGATGSAGASTVAIALAHASAAEARVVECCPPHLSGLAAAADAELGDVGGGWSRGRRGSVVIDRWMGDAGAVPAPASVEFTVVDADASSVLGPGAAGWLRQLATTVRPPVVLVTRPTVPALRRVESFLAWLPESQRPVVVAVGPAVKRWPTVVRHSIGALCADVAKAGRLVAFPEDRAIAMLGITPDSLPVPLLQAGEEILTLLRKEL